MDERSRLFLLKNPYDIKKSGSYFLNAVKYVTGFHIKNCPGYKVITEKCGFKISDLVTEDDLHKIPVIPTAYFKRNELFSVPEDKMVIKATSSGTKGFKSRVGFDRNSLLLGITMMYRFFTMHKVISVLPTNYIVLGYEPSNHTQMGAIKTAYGTTKFAPALHREYALKDTGEGYEVNIEGIRDALFRYAKLKFPVRFVGFPSYMYFLAKSLKDNGISVKLHRKSKILLGGGWKQFSQEEIPKEEFYKLIQETLGIERKNCLEFFSAVEHPLPYCKCSNGHFHVPVYSRVIIRDVHNLAPLPEEQIGILSFVSPLVRSMPLVSVMTDDLAVLYKGGTCGCGIATPFFELKGRAGVRQIKTCTAGAAEIMGGESHESH